VDESSLLVVFTLHEQRYALRLPAVTRIVRVAEITVLPGAPDIVLGVVNLQGQIIPVVDLRKRLGLAARDVQLTDHLIIARTSLRPMALLVASVIGVIDGPQSQVSASIQADTTYVAGVLKLADGLVLIHDLDTFLSPVEDVLLDQALAS